MSAALLERPDARRAPNGGVPARRAVVRWAWRLFRREWRQQLLVWALIVVAVAATLIGAAVSTNTPAPPNADFGTATDMATFNTPDPHLSAQIAALQQRFGKADVIYNQTVAIPGSINSYILRSQDPHGPFGQPMLSLVSGHYPVGPGQVAVTSGLASTFKLKVGSVWQMGGKTRTVVGIVADPMDTLHDFALVAPGQVTGPAQVTVLFDAHGVSPAKIGKNVSAESGQTAQNIVNPQTITVVAATLGMLLIALVSIGGFTVLAQRRLRSIGMLGSIGATNRHIRLVVAANGAVVGVAGAVAGLVVGLAGWLAYRPVVESGAHHLIGPFQIPWWIVGVAMVLAVIATFLAALRPARAVARLPIVAALSGRPAPPKKVHRWAAPAGIVFFVIAFVLIGDAATRGSNGSSQGSAYQALVGGFVALIVAVVLLAPFLVSVLARVGTRGPVSVRLALRDMARYRARSGSALGAISVGILIAVVVCVASAARFGNVLDYAGPNLTSSQLIVYAVGQGPGGGPGGPGSGGSGNPPAPSMASQERTAHTIATALGSHSVALESTNATLQHAQAGRNWSGPVYVATPQLLAEFGIKASQVNPNADILTMRPGLSTMSKMQLVYGNYFIQNGAGPGNGPGRGGGPNSRQFPCPPSDCLANPMIQTVNALPSGTSAPNTLTTEHAVQALHLRPSLFVAGWLIQTPQPLTASQVSNARLTAAAGGLSIETRNSIPSLTTITDWATAAGTFLALCILGMSIGLIRSETARDLRTLTATGASPPTRRMITATTAGALAFLGAVLGTIAGYIAAIAFFQDNQLDGLSSLTSIPVTNLLIIVVGMPLVAFVAGWLLAGREPAVISRQPME
ncbi:MAG TPA: FtsX-like permease family protein [Streptosporangiaceae bacterium]|nr:FtsX-like permease family protein [Streptosporangiaceae bacterium]